MNVGLFNKISDELTEYSKNYKWVCPDLMICYYGLPKSLSKLSNIIFYSIMRTKMYKEKALTKDINEDRRIYNDIAITAEDILREWDNGKYNGGKEVTTDVCNMVKRIRELSDNNVFYFWKYRGVYIFVMVREFGTWKFYNADGCVVPKILKKIVSVGSDMMFCMSKSIRRRYHDFDKTDMENSFGLFINSIIHKMNYMVANNVPKWDNKEDICEYIAILSERLKNMEDFEGLVCDDGIFQKLPFMMSKKLKEKMAEEMDMKSKKENIPSQVISSLESELIPDSPNIVKKKNRRNGIMKIRGDNLSPQKPIAYIYGRDVNPLDDALQFMKYYRAFIQNLTGGKAKFDDYRSDSLYATQILDMMAENKRVDKVFLDAWIRYFYDYGLKGEKSFKIKYTSLKVFKDTFEKFNSRYISSY